MLGKCNIPAPEYTVSISNSVQSSLVHGMSEGKCNYTYHSSQYDDLFITEKVMTQKRQKSTKTRPKKN